MLNMLDGYPYCNHWWDIYITDANWAKKADNIFLEKRK